MGTAILIKPMVNADPPILPKRVYLVIDKQEASPGKARLINLSLVVLSPLIGGEDFSNKLMNLRSNVFRGVGSYLLQDDINVGTFCCAELEGFCNQILQRRDGWARIENCNERLRRQMDIEVVSLRSLFILVKFLWSFVDLFLASDIGLSYLVHHLLQLSSTSFTDGKKDGLAKRKVEKTVLEEEEEEKVNMKGVESWRRRKRPYCVARQRYLASPV